MLFLPIPPHPGPPRPIVTLLPRHRGTQGFCFQGSGWAWLVVLSPGRRDWEGVEGGNYDDTWQPCGHILSADVDRACSAVGSLWKERAVLPGSVSSQVWHLAISCPQKGGCSWLYLPVPGLSFPLFTLRTNCLGPVYLAGWFPWEQGLQGLADCQAPVGIQVMLWGALKGTWPGKLAPGPKAKSL